MDISNTCGYDMCFVKIELSTGGVGCADDYN
jgi:hypothetical protein